MSKAIQTEWNIQQAKVALESLNQKLIALSSDAEPIRLAEIIAYKNAKGENCDAEKAQYREAVNIMKINTKALLKGSFMAYTTTKTYHNRVNDLTKLNN